ncbi:hypothetical protein [cf. Phormidesmis sp. LEGE 11477]|uniref:hypothetical protein n=1 Tax=cf. Phormidesmis sp. LEGE 11477 TaxID=1828680 RepID=UPI001D15D0A8|nr:hypothetical protein [cf. Phormidesmis sp. LEGE 11477]
MTERLQSATEQVPLVTQRFPYGAERFPSATEQVPLVTERNLVKLTARDACELTLSAAPPEVNPLRGGVAVGRGGSGNARHTPDPPPPSGTPPWEESCPGDVIEVSYSKGRYASADVVPSSIVNSRRSSISHSLRETRIAASLH